MLVTIIIILVLVIAVMFLLSRNSKLQKKNKELDNEIDQILKARKIDKSTEIKKDEIRTKYNNKKNSVLNNNVDNATKLRDNKKHNHSFRKPCTKNCPAYGEY